MRRHQRGFSLVEVVLAVGVVAFAFVAILGLIPAGMNQFRQAIDTSVCSQIAQRVIMEAQQSDFDLLTDAANTKTAAANYSFRAPKVASAAYRYFDEQGNEVIPSSANPTSWSAEERRIVVYYVNTRIIVKSSVPRTSTGSLGDNSDGLASVTVQVIANPGHATMTVSAGASSTDPVRNLVAATQKGVTIKTYNALVGRNQ